MRGQSRTGFSSHPWIHPAWTGQSNSSCPRCCLFATQSFRQLRDRQFGRLLLLLVLFLTAFQGSLPFGQTSSSADSAANLQVGHDTWNFNQGAPADVTGLAQTNDGFLWLGGPNGLFRFDGTRFDLSGRRLAIGSSRPTCIPCSGRGLAASGWVTCLGASVS